jgi:uncharacterized protein DUF6933
MITLCCTQKLQKALDIRPADELAPATNALGAWYGNVIDTHAGGLVVFCNARTFLSVAVPVIHIEQLIPLFVARVYNLLRLIEIPVPLAMGEIATYDSIQFAKTADRSVLGSLNQIVQVFKYVAEESPPDQKISLQSIEMGLGEYMHKSLGDVYPAEAAAHLLERG